MPQQNPEFVRQTFSAISRRYDFANHLLSGGWDFFWRRQVVKAAQGRNVLRILDLATGSGDLAIAFQKACPGAVVVGADFCFPMLLEAQKKSFSKLVHADGLALPFKSDTFDVVTVAFGLRNMASWPNALQEMRRVLHTGGLLLILDFSMPKQILWRAVYRFYLHRILPFLAMLATGHREAYRYLGESIEAFPSGPRMQALIAESGFSAVRFRSMGLGIVTMYSASK